MTLNGVMTLILRYFTEFGNFPGALRIKVIEDAVVRKFTFAVSSPDEFLVIIRSHTGNGLPCLDLVADAYT